MLAALVITGGPVLELIVKNDVEARLKAGGQRAVLKGTVERVSMGKGGKTWLGTAVVLDDGTPVWVTYGEPPEGWASFLGQFVTVEGGYAWQSSLTQQSMHAPHLIDPSTPTVITRPLSTLLDRRVRLVGTANDAKGGAVVIVQDTPVYVSKKTSWPKELEGKRISLGGRLIQTKYLPEATRLPSGEITQGVAPGSREYVLLDATEATSF